MSRKAKVAIGLSVVALAVFLVLTCVLLLAGPSAEIHAAEQSGVTLADATNRVAAVTGIEPAEIQPSSMAPIDSRADSQLEWADGFAAVDTSTGQVISLYQDPRRGFAVAPASADNERLNEEAARVAGLLGWDESSLSAAGFRLDSCVTMGIDQPTYTKTWIAYTNQGIRTDGLVAVQLDVRDGRVLSFFYLPGVGDVEIATAVVSEEEAQQIARKTVLDHLAERADLGGGGGSADKLALAGSMVIEDSILKVTNAKGVTGGDLRLIYLVKIVGRDKDGCVAGGTAYIDAHSGELLQYFAF